MSDFQDWLDKFDPKKEEKKKEPETGSGKTPEQLREELNPPYILGDPQKDLQSTQSTIDIAGAMSAIGIPFNQSTGRATSVKETIDDVLRQVKDRLGGTPQDITSIGNYLKQKADALTGVGGKLATVNQSIEKIITSGAIGDAYNQFNKVSKFYANPKEAIGKVYNDLISGNARDFDTAQLGSRVTGLNSLKELITNPDKYGIPDIKGADKKLPFDVEAPLKQFSDQLSAVNLKATTEGQLEDYLSKLPSELKAGREQFIAGETERAGARFREQVVPRSLEALGQRGALYSGDVEDLLTTQAFGVQNDLAGLKYQLEQQDNEFYFNAAYRDKVKKILESNLDVRQALGQERQNVLLGQSRQFQTGQQQLDIQADERLARQGYERQARAQEAQARRQRDQQERQQRQGMYGNLGQTLGTLGGIAVAPATGGASLAIPAITGAGGRALGEGFG